MKLINKSYFSLSLATVFIGLILSFTYRPYIYSSQIKDFGFADTIGSLVSVIGFCFFMWSFKHYTNPEKNKQIIIVTIIYSFGWELLSYLGIHGTFDYKDIVAAFLSGFITFVLKEILSENRINTSK